MEMPSPSFVVGIGASAGGLLACREFLGALSPATGMAFVIVCHFPADYDNHFAELVSRSTRMPVATAGDGMQVLRDRVYVIPRNADLSLGDSSFKVASPRAHRNNQIDIFFGSLAEVIGARAIGIVLTGYGSDGAAGCRRIKARGGMTFAQDDSAEVASMPHAAQATGAVDFVLSAAKIAEELMRIAGTISA